MQLVQVDVERTVQFIVDGFEHEIYASIDPDIRHVSFSKKKQRNTITKLIFTTTNGWICRLSDSYPGSLNDINLSTFPECWMHQQLYEGCVIIGDKGFRGLEAYSIYTIDGIHEENEGAFLRVRCTVENTILKIRKWKIIEDRFRRPIKNLNGACILHHKLVSAVCSLVNLFVIPLRVY